MRRDITDYVRKCSTCQQVKFEHRKPEGLLKPLDIPEWKWESIAMDFVEGLPLTRRGHNSIWVIIDRLTKSGHFIPMRKDLSVASWVRSTWIVLFDTMVHHQRSFQINELSLLPVCGRVCSVHLALSKC